MFASQRLLATLIAVSAQVIASPAPQNNASPASRLAANFNSAVVNITGNGPISTLQMMLPLSDKLPLGGLSAALFKGPAWLPLGKDLTPGLPQEETNGDSPLGTIGAPRLPPFVPDSPLPNGFPWGPRTANNTNVYQDTPETGVTRHYDFTVSKRKIAPDGVEIDGIVVNNAFPGPTIEANWGDWIEVVVHNELDEGTSLHYHGLLQTATPWYDGVPGVQQCPIAPGSTFTYRFRADLYGSSWWHSHYSAQYAAGVFGPMIVYGPHDNMDYDEDLGPVLVTDWYHKDYFSLVEQVMAPAAQNLPPPASNNVLINGRNNYPCPANATGVKCTPNAGVSKFRFESGKSYRIRFINAGSEGMQTISIDGHNLTVIANDFVPVVPYTTNALKLGIGQRTDVVVQADGKPTDAVWMRSTLGPAQGGCAVHDGVSPTAVAAIYYESTNDTAVPQSTSDVPNSYLTRCQNDDLNSTVPYYPIQPPQPDTVQNVAITLQSNGTNNLFYMNNSTFRANYNDPVLLDAKLGQTDFPAHYNVYNFGASRSIRIVFYNHAQAGAHPMHMHGHNIYVLAQGTGTWDGQIVNPANPERRDVQLLPPAPDATTPSYIVVQFDADNPGVWPFHCHIAWHVSGGLYINVLERPDDIQNRMPIPAVMAQTCRDWSNFTQQAVVEQIDSGL